MGIKIEKYYPILLGIILTILSFWWKDSLPPIESVIDKVTEHIFDVYSILIGFLLTILTILKSMEGKAMDAIRKNEDRFQQLISYLICAISMAAIMVLYCLLLPFIPRGNPPTSEVIDYLFVFLFVFSLSTSYRFLDIFFTIIRIG